MNPDNRAKTSSFVVKFTELKHQLRKHAVLWPMLMVALTTCITLSACGGPSGQPQQAAGSQPQQAVASQPQQAADNSQAPQAADSQGGPWADTITGTVVWPDGTPAANAPIDIFPDGQAGGGTIETTGPDGSYTSRACAQFTCSNLQAWFAPPASASFGDACYIQMSTNLGSDQGFTLNQGQVNWAVDPQNCDTTPGAKDISHPLTWQQAEGIVNGTLTYQQAQADNGTPVY